MKLGEAKAFGMLDHDDGGIGDVDADFNDCGRHQNLAGTVLGREGLHGGILVGGLHLPVQQADLIAEEFLEVDIAVFRCGEIDGFGLFDQRADPIDFRTVHGGASDAGHGFVQPFEADEPRVDRRAAGRLFVKPRDVHIAVSRKRERARDGGGGHHEDVGARAFVGQIEALMNAEAMLLVDHCQREIMEFHVFLEQGMRADHDVNAARGDVGQDFGTRASLDAAR